MILRWLSIWTGRKNSGIAFAHFVLSAILHRQQKNCRTCISQAWAGEYPDPHQFSSLVWSAGLHDFGVLTRLIAWQYPKHGKLQWSCQLLRRTPGTYRCGRLLRNNCPKSTKLIKESHMWTAEKPKFRFWPAKAWLSTKQVYFIQGLLVGFDILCPPWVSNRSNGTHPVYGYAARTRLYVWQCILNSSQHKSPWRTHTSLLHTQRRRLTGAEE